MTKTNETITLNSKMGLELDFNRIEYKDAEFKGRRWFTARLDSADVRALCGKDGKGYFSVTEDELETALHGWLSKMLNCEVASFRWMWDTYSAANVA